MKIRINNTYCQLIIGGVDYLADPDMNISLRNYMSVAVPGAFFSPQYKKQQWDGKRYFITPKGKMATGFLPLLLKYIEEVYPDLRIEFFDERGDIPKFKDEFVAEIGSLEIDEEYEHQKRMIQSYSSYVTYHDTRIYFPRGIMNAATNAGKTAAIMGIYLNLERETKMLILIHRKVIFNQLYLMLGELIGFEKIGRFNDKLYDIRPVTIAMIKTVYNRLGDSINVKKDLAQFEVVAVDECHLAGSKTYSKVLQNIEAPIRLFVSGTPFDSDAIINKMVAIGLSGPEVVNVSKRELMDKGISLEVKIHMHLCNTVALGKTIVYRDYIDQLIHYSVQRVKIMGQIIKDYKGTSTLIAVEEIAHGQTILKLLSQYFALDDDPPVIDFVYGEDPARDDKIQRFSYGEINVLISTCIMKEGINIPIVNNLIYAVGEKAKIDIKQWMGRIERRFKNTKQATMHDFYDIGKYVEAHSRKRIRTYRNEALEVIEHYNREEIRKIKNLLDN